MVALVARNRRQVKYGMNEVTANEIGGLEFDWLGCDDGGNLAFFSTAGGGYVPDRVLQNADAQADAVAAILAGKSIAAARFAPELAPHCINTWKMAAERGMFAFDADIGGGPYKLVAAPNVPIRVEQLPARISDAFRDIKFRFLNFAELKTLTARTLRDSIPDSPA
jgi:hypothetical protein